MPDMVRVAGLTTCEIADGGAQIRLHMLDETGRPVTLALPTQLASSLILTLPGLMDRCLRELRGDATRLVFPMHCWTLEAAAAAEAFILTVETPDGFRVAFAVSMDDARGLAEAFQTYCPTTGVSAPAPMLN
jgi:hypothetical protein